MKTWKDITLRQAQALEAIDPHLDRLDTIVEQLSILKGIPVEEIERTWTPEDVFIEADKWSFLSSLPAPKEVKDLTIDGREYGMCNLGKLTLAQMVDIEEYYNVGIVENAHKIMAVLFLPKKKKWNPFKRSELEDYEWSEERESDMLEANMEFVWGNMLFFCGGVKRYTIGLLAFSQEMLKTSTKTEQTQSQEQSEVEGEQ